MLLYLWKKGVLPSQSKVNLKDKGECFAITLRSATILKNDIELDAKKAK